VGISTTVEANIPGDALFVGAGGAGSASDLFAQVIAFRNALSANPPAYNVATVNTAVDNLKTVYARVLTNFTDLGGRQNSLDQLKSTLGDFNIGLQSIQETYEAVDYPQAITEYEREGTAQQVSLSILAKSNAQNLFDYLG
jgi:flagellin-like hook-associated protein FlgL